MKKVGAKNSVSRVWGALSPLGRRSEGRQWVQRSRVGTLQSERSWRKDSDSVSGQGVMAEIPTKQMGTKSPQRGLWAWRECSNRWTTLLVMCPLLQ